MSARWRRGGRGSDRYGWPRYVSVAERRALAQRKVASLEKDGHRLAPVVSSGRLLARTFWGEAWCRNLERYSDFANRLPRGRTYLRHGSLIDLQIGPGEVTGRVMGNSLYTVSVQVTRLARRRWKEICNDCAGAIDSLVELLQGRLSSAVMNRICREDEGLFPRPHEIVFSCTCPDWADMCKHVAAVLYGIGVRLDDEPELLFRLRQVEPAEMVRRAEARLVAGTGTEEGSALPEGIAPERVLTEAGPSALADLFGVDFEAFVGKQSAEQKATEQDGAEQPAGGPELSGVARKEIARLKARQRRLLARIEKIDARLESLCQEWAQIIRGGLPEKG